MATHDCTTDESEDLNSESLDLNSDSPSTLEEIIEKERTQLMIAGHVLGCASVAIENDRSADRHDFHYPDVIEVGRTMIDETINRLDSVYLRAFYEQLRKARRDFSQIEADASSGMTIATAGHMQPLLTINTGIAECGDISDGVSFVHHNGTSAEDGLRNASNCWVLSFADLEAIYYSAVAKRAAKQGGAIPDEADGEAASRESIKQLKDGMATAVKRLRGMEHDLESIGASVYVCVEALRGPHGDEVSQDAARVLEAAYVKLVEHVAEDVRNALTALGQDGGK